MSSEFKKPLYEYFIFTDPHILGGQSFTLITRKEIIETYNNSCINSLEEDLIQNFLTINFATPLSREQYLNILSFNTKHLLKK